MDQYNNAYHQSINEKLINADYSALSENIESNPKLPKFEVNDRVRITGCTILCFYDKKIVAKYIKNKLL